MSCNCAEKGKDGTHKHSGILHTLEWIKNPLDIFDWIGRTFKVCDNHLNNYLTTGYHRVIK